MTNFQIIYTGSHFLSATNGILVFKANKNWTRIVGVRLSVLTPSLSNAVFNLKQNGVNLFSGSELTITGGTKQIDLTTLDFDVAATDEFRLDLTSVLTRVNAPLILELTVETSGGSGGASSLEELSDVDLTAPAEGDVFIFDGEKWINGTAPGGGGGADELDELTDVEIIDPEDGETLIYDAVSEKFVNAPPPSGGGLPPGGTEGQILAKDSNDDGDAVWIDPNAGSENFGIDYEIDFEETFSDTTVGAEFVSGGVGFSISGGNGQFMPVDNSAGSGNSPYVETVDTVNMHNKILIMKIIEKPEVGTTGYLAFFMDVGAYSFGWDLYDSYLKASGNNITLATFSTVIHFLRMRIQSNASSGSTTHIIYYEYSFNGKHWYIGFTSKITGVDLSAVKPSVRTIHYGAGAPPSACKVDRFIIADPIYVI